MSGLAAVLAGRHEPGVYRWHAAFAADQVAHTVEHAGWRFAHLDAWPTDTKAEFLERIATALDLPDWFGRNYDALADCLRDLDGTGLVLLLDGLGPFAHGDESGEHHSFAGALDVLRSRATDSERAPFLVLLRGDGPELSEVTSLD